MTSTQECGSNPSNKRTSYQDDSLDPRIQDELEKLNKASEDINRLELSLDEARSTFRQVLTESTHHLNALAKKLGSCIEKARPYYEARVKAKEAQQETQKAALRFERACGQLMAAKEMVNLAEQGFFTKGQPFDPAWQEMLNHATIKVNDAENERYESEIEHQQTAMAFSAAEQTVQNLHKQLKRNILKSRPYFEQKARFNQHMEDQKRLVGDLEQAVQGTKKLYADALRNLEAISDEIHQQRKENAVRRHMGKRGSGVGAESPSPPPPLESSPEEEPVSQSHIKQASQKRISQGEDKSSHSIRSISSSVEKQNGAASQIEPMNASSQSPLPSKFIVKRPATLVATTTHPLRQLSSPAEPPQPVQLPVVELTTPGTGPAKSTDAAVPVNKSAAPVSQSEPLSPDEEETSLATNAEVMECVQRAKRLHLLKPGMRKRSSQDDLLEGEGSDTESMSGSLASMSVLDDDQLESLMLEPGDIEQLIATLESSQAQKWHAMPLPAKLGYLEDFVRQKSIRIGSSGGGSSEGEPISSVQTPSGGSHEDDDMDDMGPVFEKCVRYKSKSAAKTDRSECKSSGRPLELSSSSQRPLKIKSSEVKVDKSEECASEVCDVEDVKLEVNASSDPSRAESVEDVVTQSHDVNHHDLCTKL